MNGPQRERIKVTIVLSNISKLIRLAWLCENFDRDRFDLSFLILNAGDSEIETWLRERDMSVERIRYRGKKDFPRALAQGYRLLRRWRPDIVHAHLFDATLVAMIAGRAARGPARGYTRARPTSPAPPQSRRHPHHPPSIRSLVNINLANPSAGDNIHLFFNKRTPILEWDRSITVLGYHWTAWRYSESPPDGFPTLPAGGSHPVGLI